MKKTLGGAMFTRNCQRYDYCFMESLACLLDLCDEVCVCDVGSSDGTLEKLKELESGNKKLIVVGLSEDTWIEDQKLGKVRIAKYQNLAKSLLATEYYIVLQADEVLHEKSFDVIRSEIETDKEAFMFNRINFWKDKDHYVDVSEDRQPCSRNVIRLAKTKYDSVGDGESIECSQFVDVNWVDIYHYGFIRDRIIMKEKVKSLQIDTFRLENYDPKLDQADYFKSELWFSGSDLSEFEKTHPKYIKKWLQERA